MEDKNKLFSGKPSIFGGLSNEDELVKICPKRFRESNEWSNLANKIFFNGADIKQWKFKNPEEKGNQLSVLMGLLSTFGIKHEDKEAVGGWMLSEILTDIPE